MNADALAGLRAAEREIVSRRPEHSIAPSLDRIVALMELLGDPQRACPVIHITGTNGKTSTARMTETLLRARGLRTGLFTSPHLSDIRERILVDGGPLSAERFVAAYAEIKPYLDLVDSAHPVRLSFFEVLVGMAFSVFADAPVDVAVIEVGLGGTWDNTNVADGAVAVITPISLDHTRYLGSTVRQIAADKAGIIKPGAVAVLAQQPLDAAEELLRRAAEVGATVAREGMEFGVLSRELAVGGQRVAIRGLLGDYDELFLPLYGAHQAGNLACAIAAVEAFAGAGRAGPDGAPSASAETTAQAAVQPDGTGAASTDARAGAAGAVGPAGAVGAAATAATAATSGASGAVGAAGMTGPGAAALDAGLVRQAVAEMSSPGRLEVLRRSPVVLVDAAHNPAGMAATVAALDEAFTFTGLIAVFAVSADKDVPGILDQLEPAASRLVVTANSSPRSMDPGKLAELAESSFGPGRVSVAPRLEDAIDQAVALADALDAAADQPGGAGVLITGSVITAGDARQLLRGGPAAGPPAGSGTGQAAGGAATAGGQR